MATITRFTIISLYIPHLMSVLIQCQLSLYNTSEYCLNGGNCNAIDGTCTCNGPFQGIVCEIPTATLPDNVDSVGYGPDIMLLWPRIVVVLVVIGSIIVLMCCLIYSTVATPPIDAFEIVIIPQIV
jgi:hypothetical protein